MKQLTRGQFYGQTNETLCLDGITLTDTEYTHAHVGWHYHELPYFTFILQGNILEGNKKELYHCAPGTLLFHNWQEPHYNIKPEGFTRGFQIEPGLEWADNVGFDFRDLQGNIHISNPNHTLLLYKIFKESKLKDTATTLSVQGLLLQLLSGMQQVEETALKGKPLWVRKIPEILHDPSAENITLSRLAALLGVHPVHLSRDFSRYFHCGFGDYFRKQKIIKSLDLLAVKKHSLTGIAFECGFADQSHFTRCFREHMGISPLSYRKMLLF
ncbi:MAG: helix-turn-helix transcriptional regulator [Bacteroidota bacterium]